MALTGPSLSHPVITLSLSRPWVCLELSKQPVIRQPFLNVYVNITLCPPCPQAPIFVFLIIDLLAVMVTPEGRIHVEAKWSPELAASEQVQRTKRGNAPNSTVLPSEQHGWSASCCSQHKKSHLGNKAQMQGSFYYNDIHRSL